MSQLKIKYSILSENIIQKKDLKKLVRKLLNLSESAYNNGPKQKIDRFIKSHDQKFKKECHFNKTTFELKNKNWLDRELILDNEVLLNQVDGPGDQFESIDNQVEEELDIQSGSDRKRRSRMSVTECTNKRRITSSNLVKRMKPFEMCSSRTKRRRCQKIRTELSDSQMNQIYMNYLKNSDRQDDAKILEKLRSASPDRKAKILEILNEHKEVIPYTSDEALALIVDADLSTYQYNLIQQQAKSRNANIYPSYYYILESKKMCYPIEESITISDTCVNICLQQLVDHTSTRQIQSLDSDVLQNFVELQCKYKWGMDGASGQSQYKLSFASAEGTDKSILMVSLVLLQIASGSTVLWQNPKASSTRFCRPIRFEFVKEDQDTIKDVFQLIQDQIDSLKSTSILIKDKQFQATHDFELTMIDGKVVDYLTDTTFSNCNVCGAKPTQMNNIDVLRTLTCNKDNYNFGLSTLHCWIRFLECCLHVAYRLPIKRTDVRGLENKAIVKENKERIQNAFKAETDLLDIVKPGYGTTNDGNTARRFFKDPKSTAKITGLDESLLNRFRIILVTLSCGKDVDANKFRAYGLKTAELFISLYSWYKMPPSLHKVLIHGADIISSLNLPIGLYSEEAQEARNKDFKRIREHHTRKMSRIETNEDLINGLLILSDPFITSLRTPFDKPKHKYDDEVTQLLKE